MHLWILFCLKETCSMQNDFGKDIRTGAVSLLILLFAILSAISFGAPQIKLKLVLSLCFCRVVFLKRGHEANGRSLTKNKPRGRR